jgi:transcription-repair coupling factor (superfamily II helicase)
MSNGVPPFSQFLLNNTAFAEAVSELWNGKSISVDGVVGSSCALAVAAVAQRGKKPVLIIVPTQDDAEKIVNDLDLFSPATNNLLFPALENKLWISETEKVENIEKAEKSENEEENILALADNLFGQRIRVLKELTTNRKKTKNATTNKIKNATKNEETIIVATFFALQQPVPPEKLLRERTQTLRVGNQVDLEKLRRYLVEGGFHNTSAVDLPGEFAVRGYILDLFAPDWEQPVRVEFFDDEIESIRRFDIATQRSLENVQEIELTRLLPNEAVGASLLDYLPPQSPIILLEPREIENAARRKSGE